LNIANYATMTDYFMRAICFDAIPATQSIGYHNAELRIRM